MELSCSSIKKFLILSNQASKFFLEKTFSYFFWKKTPLQKKLLISREIELSSLKIKKLS